MSVITRLTDIRSVEYGLASSIAVGSLTLIDPHQPSGARRVAYRLLMAASAAAVVAVELRAQPEYADADPIFHAATPAAAAGLMLAVARPAEWIDARIQRRLVARGVRRPRVLMAAGSTACSFVSFLIDRRVAPTTHRAPDPLRTP